MQPILAAWVFVLLFGGSALAGPREDMMATDSAFSEMSVKEGAHAAFLAFMTDDVRLFDGDHPPILGKAAAAAHYADVEKKDPAAQSSSTLAWTPIEAETSTDGTLGWTRGTWVFSAKKPDGSPLSVTGYYVTEWRRGADGKYKFVLDIGGADGS